MAEEPLRCYQLTRHRWVNGNINAKCDRETALTAAQHHGGRVDQSYVLAYTDGREHLGEWHQIWPPVERVVVQPAAPAEPGMVADACAWCRYHGYTPGQKLNGDGVPIGTVPDRG